MDNFEQLLNIPEIGSETNFWMVRAKRGFFFDEFLREKYIAIGWNCVTKSMLSDLSITSQSENIKADIKETYDESRPGTALRKCIRFCNEMKEGDIAVIVDNNRVAFAYVGDYYEENASRLTIELEKEVNRQIESTSPEYKSFECPYIKRRKISIIKVLNKDDTVSPYLQNAIARNWHSLSNLNEYAELILSGCFDTVIYDGKLTVTFRVRRKEDINVFDFNNFVFNTARLLSEDQIKNVNVKTTLHSPGDIVLQVWNTFDDVIPLLICYMIVFGGKMGDYECNSLIGIIKSLANRKYKAKIQELELRKLSAECDVFEQQARAQELANIEKEKEIRESIAVSCVAPLSDAAKQLKVEPSEATIIDLANVIEVLNEKRL
jgi:hypothetical protein